MSERPFKATAAGPVPFTDEEMDQLTTDAAANPTPLQAAQATQQDLILAALQASITGGFTSSALGADHLYPGTLVDQQNLSANVVSSLLPGLPGDWATLQLCADAMGDWGYRAHTASQIQRVGQESKAAVLAALVKKAALFAQIDAATTVDAVRAIAWTP